jgi:hypothetical protein
VGKPVGIPVGFPNTSHVGAGRDGAGWGVSRAVCARHSEPLFALLQGCFSSPSHDLARGAVELASTRLHMRQLCEFGAIPVAATRL